MYDHARMYTDIYTQAHKQTQKAHSDKNACKHLTCIHLTCIHLTCIHLYMLTL